MTKRFVPEAQRRRMRLSLSSPCVALCSSAVILFGCNTNAPSPDRVVVSEQGDANGPAQAEPTTAANDAAQPVAPPVAPPVAQPVAPPATRRTAVQLAIWDRLACARMDDGGVRCWGQLESKSDIDQGTNRRDAATPVQIPGVDDAIDIGINRQGVWVLAADGRVRVGRFDPYAATVWSPSTIEIGEPASKLVVTDNALVMTEAGGLVVISPNLRLFPLALGEQKAVDIKRVGTEGVGADASRSILLANGSVTQWPLNPNFTGVTALFDGNCARDGDGVFCWHDDRGKLVTQRHPGLQAAMRGDITRCELTDASELRCRPTRGYTPFQKQGVETVEIPKVASVALGDFRHPFYCAITADDQRVLCWGDNCSGQLGDGTLRDHHEPAEVIGLDDLVLPPVVDGRSDMSELGPEEQGYVEDMWSGLPRACKHDDEIPLGDGMPPLRVVRAYSGSPGFDELELTFADFHVARSAPHRATRGNQRIVVIKIRNDPFAAEKQPKIERGTYKSSDPGRQVFANLKEGAGWHRVSDPAGVVIDKITDEWICGEIQDWVGADKLDTVEPVNLRFAARRPVVDD